MNTADAEEMARALTDRGFSSARDMAEADWVLVNTCTVRQHAEDKACSYLGRLKPWKAAQAGRRIVVTGCAAERLQTEIRHRFPQVDLVVGAKSIAAFQEKVGDLLGFDAQRDYADPWAESNDFTSFQLDPAVANVTIMRGCNYGCAYCIVPQVRGREVYRPLESVLAEVRQKTEAGYREILLLGQTVNSYRPSGQQTDFADLLRAVNAVPGARRVRFMSPHPFYLNERMIAAVAEGENICPHVHMPVQSGSDAVLRRMRRNYTRAEFLKRTANLRAARRVALTTDFIVGFPGETEEDFQATLSLLEEADFDSAYCFKYSPRPGTPAALGPDDVPLGVKEERLARLLELTRKQSEIKAQGQGNARHEVLVERVFGGDHEKGARVYEGRDQSFWKIQFTSDASHRPGEIVPVWVGEPRGRTLTGRAMAPVP